MSEVIQGLTIAIRFPDGRGEQLVIDSDCVLVGSGAHCEVRLAPEWSAVEHVELSLVGTGVHAKARAMKPLPTLDGMPFTQAQVSAEAVIGIGPVQLRASQTMIADDVQAIRKKAPSTSPRTYALALLAIALMGYILLLDESQDRATAAPADVPSLFTAAAQACPQSAPDQALALAYEKKLMAEGKRERRPFHVQDGVAAVPLFDIAGECFRAAGQAGPAADMTNAAIALRAKVNEDYRAHQVRLEHALTVNDLVTAQKEVSTLRAFTEGRAGAYVVWLSNLDRRLQLKLGRKEGSS